MRQKGYLKKNLKQKEKEMKYREWVECEECEGTGHDIFMKNDGIICPKCKGTGERR